MRLSCVHYCAQLISFIYTMTETQPEPQSIMWKCTNCEQQMDISNFGYFDMAKCPTCQHMTRVHTKLAHFNLEKIIGVGGMSIVLKAYDTLLERHVAVKILNPDCRQDPHRMAGFEKECKLMASVQHPNVVKVYTAGHERGHFYFAMELLNGVNIESSLKGQKKIHPVVVLKMAHLLAKGLQAAHEMGVLHRDIKPGNILLTKSGEAKLIDFGLALRVNERDESETIWATPYYAAPETLMQEKEDERADIYSLGMTLRSILTLEDIFQCDKVVLTGRQWLEKKRTMKSIRKRLPDLDKEIAQLIDHMTQFNISKRPKNYASLILQIEDTMEILQAKMAGNYPVKRYNQLSKTAAVISLLCLGISFAPLSSSDELPITKKPALTAPENGTKAPRITQPIERKEGDEQATRIAQLQEKMLSASSVEVLADASQLSHDADSPLHQLWGLELKWTISYMESGSDDLLLELRKQMEELLPQVKALSLSDGQAELKNEILRTADYMIGTSIRASQVAVPFSSDASYALQQMAQIALLGSLENSKNFAEAMQLLSRLETDMEKSTHPLHALRAELAIVRHRLERQKNASESS